MSHKQSTQEALKKTSPHKEQMVIADYLMMEVVTTNIDVVFLSPHVQESCLMEAAKKCSFEHVVSSISDKDALVEALAYARARGTGCVVINQESLITLLHEIVTAIDDGIPLAIIMITGQKFNTIIENATIKAMESIQGVLESTLGAYMIIDDRRLAATRIDRALDTLQALHLPIMIEISEEVARSYMPPHIYRKTIFNHDEQDLLASVWDTMFSRIKEASRPTLVIGKQIRRREWSITLCQIAKNWNMQLFIDPEITGSVPKHFLGEYTPFTERTLGQTEYSDSLFCFGIESENRWQKKIIEEQLFYEELPYDLIAMNSSYLFFSGQDDVISISSLEDFFLIRPSILHESIIQSTQKELPLPENRTEEKTLSYSIDQISSSISVRSTFFLFLSNKDKKEAITTKLKYVDIVASKNQEALSWFESSIKGTLFAKKSALIGVVTDDISFAQQIMTSWNSLSQNNLRAKLLVVLMLPSIPETLQQWALPQELSLQKWLKNPHGSSAIVIVSSD